MEMEMYCVYDRKLREYGAIWLAANPAVAVRNMQATLRGSGAMMEKFPEDFEVHKIGSFNNTTGEVKAEGRPVVVAQLDTVLAHA